MIPLPPNTELMADAEATARAAADHLLSITERAEGDRVTICLSGGSTPKRLYALLASPALSKGCRGRASTGSSATTGSCRGTIP
ncbi:hypothetical protein GCM10025880_26950 [Methylorubrum aminovorans]|nr:hypothetical protein GCM10025880_26950 [Methylorubrum aminovorans]